MTAMTTGFLSFRNPRFRAVAPPPDLPVQTVPLLTGLRDALQLSAKLLSTCEALRDQAEHKQRQWGEPNLFFFDRAAQTEWEQVKPTRPTFPNDYFPKLPASVAGAVQAWQELPDLLDDALTVLPASSECRRVARATDGLKEAAQALSPFVPAAGELAALLAIPDEEIVLVVDVDRRAAARVLMTGVADLSQLTILLAGELPARRRPDSRVLAAYRNEAATSNPLTVEAPFQLMRPSALRADGSVAPGFASSDHWYWGPESTAELPREKGERVVLLTAATIPHSWEVARRFPRLPGQLDVVEVLSRPALTSWFRSHCPNLLETPYELARAA